MTLIGRNEFGDFGGPGDNDYNWTFPETWNFNMSAGQYLYVLAWDDGDPQSWIGQFNFGNNTLFSNQQDWLYTSGDSNPGVNGQLPTTASVEIYLVAQTGVLHWLKHKMAQVVLGYN